MGRKISIENLSNSQVIIFEPSLNMHIVWQAPHAKRLVDLELLQQAIYSPGVERLFTEGFLGIAEKDSLKILVELGLEEDGVNEPQNIIVLTDAQRKRLLTTAPLKEFKDTLETLPLEQMIALTDFAIQNKITDYEKSLAMKKACGVDVIKAVELKRQNEEKDTKED